MKVYTLDYVVRYQGVSVEPPVFSSISAAADYMTGVVAPEVSAIKFERDDSILEDGEKARWYELREDVYVDTGTSVRDGNYYRIMERELL